MVKKGLPLPDSMTMKDLLRLQIDQSQAHLEEVERLCRQVIAKQLNSFDSTEGVGRTVVNFGLRTGATFFEKGKSLIKRPTESQETAKEKEFKWAALYRNVAAFASELGYSNLPEFDLESIVMREVLTSGEP